MNISGLLTGYGRVKLGICSFNETVHRGKNFARTYQAVKLTNRAMSSKQGAPSLASADEQDKFITDVFEMCMKRVVQGTRDRNTPVVNFKTPEELKELVDFDLTTDGNHREDLLSLCEKVFDYSVLTGHPRFFNQQYGGLDSYGVAGSFITDVINANGHTFEIAPMFLMTEVAVLEHMLKFVGYTNGEGTFCPGGSYSNFLSMNMARLWKFPETKSTGIYGLPKLVSFCSEQAHYSAKKNSTFLGYGTDNCWVVKCDDRGKMIPEEFEKLVLKCKDEGSVPLFVTATAGTTVLGSFDPFNEIAAICSKHKIWMHVDAAWGGSALLSKKYKHLCDGVHKADSLAWNAHKMMQAPLQCSVVLFKEKGSLERAHSLNVPYLFQSDKPYDVKYDLGRNLLQCSRKCDALKLWLMWKAKGDAGFERQVDQAMANAQYLTEQIRKRPEFELVIPHPEYTNVPFWYIPPSLKGKEKNEDYFKQLASIIPTIKTRMQKSGTLLVGYTPVGKIPTFFRMTVMNDKANFSDMDFVLDEIVKNGKDL
nr:cysteine sulfinic acid decarboxylase isoform X1 [Ciona intestinalis]|eukprot:XP_009858609.1 cysteine sulfinic acid decarboxylase isoform X1 [Ciona intestinalis]